MRDVTISNYAYALEYHCSIVRKYIYKQMAAIKFLLDN